MRREVRGLVTGWVLERVMAPTGPLRRECVQGLSGRVLELGVGTGVTLPHYPDSVEEVVGVDLDGALLRRATKRAQHLPHRFEAVRADLTKPFDGLKDSFDAIVITFALCSIPRCGELLERLRPSVARGAEFRLLEHVAADGMAGRAQLLVRPIYRPITGCEPSLSLESLLENAGFEHELRVCQTLLPFPCRFGRVGRAWCDTEPK